MLFGMVDLDQNISQYKIIFELYSKSEGMYLFETRKEGICKSFIKYVYKVT